MALSPALLTMLLNAGTSTAGSALANLFGQHVMSVSNLAGPLAIIKMSNDPAQIKNAASIISQQLMTSNPSAAMTAMAMAASPERAQALIGVLEQEIQVQNSNILTSLQSALSTTTTTTTA